jgi:hypothetical protein
MSRAWKHNNRCNKVRNRINYQQVNIYGFHNEFLRSRIPELGCLVAGKNCDTIFYLDEKKGMKISSYGQIESLCVNGHEKGVEDDTFRKFDLSAKAFRGKHMEKVSNFYITLIGCNEINFYCKFIDTAKK